MTKSICTAVLLAATYAPGQGTFLYDQQSSTQEGSPAYGEGSPIQDLLPSTGQSFTPGFSGVNFIRLTLDDGNPYDALGATIYLNLRSDSITGTILGSTTPVTMANGFRGTQNFLFPSTVPLTAGTTYYFELVLVSGGTWNAILEPHTYHGGVAYAQGTPYLSSDYWFREGIYVPEPSPISLALAAAAALGLRRRRHSGLRHKTS